MSEGPIPWDKCDQYAEKLHLTETEADELWEVVSKLDKVYTDWRAAKSKVDQSRIGSQSKTKPRRK